MPNLVNVSPLPNFCVHLAFEDGTAGEVDLSRLAGRGVFSAWQNVSFFNQVAIGEFGELTWGEGIDLCPDALYLQLTGKTPEAVISSASLDSHA